MDFIRSLLAVIVVFSVLNTVSGQEVCPNRVYMETVNVGSTDSDGVDSASTLASGANYLLKASGTYVPTSLSGAYADAEYLTLDNWATTNRVVGSFTIPEGVHDLLVDKAQVDWGAYNSNHQYSYLYGGNGAPVNLQIDDWYLDSGDPWNCHTNYAACMSDNSGSLTVDVYCCPTDEIRNGVDDDCDGQVDEDGGYPLPEFASAAVVGLILVAAPTLAYLFARKYRR